MKKGALIASYLLHPLLMPLLGIYILFNSGNYLSLMPLEGQNAVYLIVATCTLMLPLSAIPFFMYQNVIKTLHMSEKHERIAPFALSLIFYFFGFYILQKVGAPRSILLFILGGSFCVFANLIVNLGWKISAHMIALGGIAAMTLCIAFKLNAEVSWWLMLVFLFSGLAGTSRLILHEHTPGQVYIGFAIGFIIMTLTYNYFNYL